MNLGGALLESKGKKGNSRKRAQKKKIGGLTLGAPWIIPGSRLVNLRRKERLARYGFLQPFGPCSGKCSSGSCSRASQFLHSFFIVLAVSAFGLDAQGVICR